MDDIKTIEQATERMIKAQELSAIIDTSVQTITTWYAWKAENPDHELAKLLPEYTRIKGGRKTRFWKESEVWRLIEFKRRIPQGRNGFMGKVTQKYVYKVPSAKRYIQAAVNLLNRNNVDSEVVDIIREFLDEEFAKRNAA